MPEGELLKPENIAKIRQIPAIIVQGRFDMVCPITTAYELSKAWPEAKFVRRSSRYLFLRLADARVSQVVIPDAGHSAIEAGTEKALVEATEEFAKLE